MNEKELTDEQRERLTEASRLVSLSQENYQNRRFVEAAQLINQALEIREEVLGPNHIEVAQALYYRASIYFVQGRYSEVEADCQRTISILEGTHGDHSQYLISALIYLAESRFKQRQYDLAEEPYLRAVSLAE